MPLVNVTGCRDLSQLFWFILTSPSTPAQSFWPLSPHSLVVSISRILYFKSFSMTFVNVFQSEGTDTSLSLQHQLAWSLITIYQVYSQTVPYQPVSPYPRELWLVLIPPLWGFCAAVLACLPMDIRMQLPYCTP